MTSSAVAGSLDGVRLRHDPVMSFAAPLALCDACFPRPLCREQTLFPISTIDMNPELHADDEDLPGLRYLFLPLEANGTLVVRGFCDQPARSVPTVEQLPAGNDQMPRNKMP